MTTATITAPSVPERRAQRAPKWKTPFFYDERLVSYDDRLEELRAEIARSQADLEALRRSRAMFDAALRKVEGEPKERDSKERDE